jgi:hypothetical protein
MGEDSADDVLILNTGDDPYGTTAAAANLDIDLENTLEPLGPGHRGMTLGGEAIRG